MFGLLALAAALGDRDIEAMVKRAPQPVRAFIERRQSCNHWAGEEPYDKDRAREIESALRAGRCNRLERDARGLRRRYAREPQIGRLIALTADWY